MNAITTTIEGTKLVSGLGWLQRRAPSVHSDINTLLPYLQQRSAKTETIGRDNAEIGLHYIEEPQTRDDINRLAVVIDGKPLEMTHWSFSQLCGLAKAPAAFMRDLPASIASDAIMWQLRHNREVQGVQLYHDGTELRSINGPGYGRIDDHEIVEAIGEIIDSGRWVPATGHMGLRATDRSLQMFLIDRENPVVVGRAPNGTDDVMYRGLRISNSEVGYSSLAVDGFFFRSYCMNGMIFGMKDASRFTIRHSKGAPARWAREIEPAIQEYAATDGKKLVDAVAATKESVVAKDDDAAVNFLNGLNVSRTKAREAMEYVLQEEGRPMRTAWDAVQGLTAMARNIAGTEERADMERLAGRVWERATRRIAA